MVILRSNMIRFIAYGSVALAVFLAAAPMGWTGTPTEVAAVRLYEDSPQAPELYLAVNASVAQGVPPQLLETLIARAHENDLPVGTLLGWVRKSHALVVADLPLSPVFSRYLQGLAKRIPPARIDAVVSDLETRLLEAAHHIDKIYSFPQDARSHHARLIAIDHAAYALGLGVSTGVMDRSLQMARNDGDRIEPAQAPVLALGILVAAGITPEKSLEVVDVAWVHGYRGGDLERLGKALGRLGRDGTPPSAEVVDEILKMIGNDASQDLVFQGLDDLTGREEYRLPGLEPGDDPTLRRGERTREDPTDSPNNKDQIRPVEREGQ